MLIDFKNKIYTGSAGRKSLFDCTIPDNPKALIIFVHGYKGYKDWGAWNLMEDFFVKAGFGFIKFNLTHNGGTVDNPIDFDDLEAFGKNCYTFEINDLDIIIEEVYRMASQELELTIPIYLLGHSRGGGVALLAGSRNKYISKIISLAGISDIGVRFPVGDELMDWERDGLYYVQNGRTKQEMPHFYSFYIDYLNHQEELNIEKEAKLKTKDFLQIHGDMDLSVSISEGLAVANWTNTELVIIKGAGHTFGAQQPWEFDYLPEDLVHALRKCLIFFDKPLK
ncbi:alpha/beta hydrolase [Crocinitomix sp.]|nr:alpha/beta hydrolase [Crocinitomix sp.]